MCQAKPGLRCSSVVWKQLQQAQAFSDENKSPEAVLRLDKARKQYLLTPAGVRTLEAQGKLAEAAECMEHSERLRRLGRFSQDLTNIDAHWHGSPNLRPDVSDHLTRDAYRIAVIAHSKVSRKNGEPYINHPLRVAYRLRRYSPVVQAVALLHDAVEDSDLTLDDLKALGIPKAIVRAVDAMTKRQGEDYHSAVIRAAQNPYARLVKLSDTLDNSSRQQLACFTEEKRQKQTRKYGGARKILVPIIKQHDELRKALLVADSSKYDE